MNQPCSSLLPSINCEQQQISSRSLARKRRQLVTDNGIFAAVCFTAEDTTVKNKDLSDAVHFDPILEARRHRRYAVWLVEAICGGAHSAMEMEAALSMCE